MNKESIYRIIGYHGKYTDSVKRALRKLLKENHPDRNGDKDIFKLINDVKSELETNQVSFKYNEEDNKIKYDDIDIDYCNSVIEKLTKEKKNLEETLIKHNDELKKINNEYKVIYRESVNDKGKILEKEKSIKKLNEIKIMSIILLFVLIIVFIIAVIKNSLIMFIGFGIMCLITIILIEKYFLYLHEITKENEKKIYKYVKTIDNIKNVSITRDNKEKERLLIERKLKKIENDLRFYHNLLK